MTSVTMIRWLAFALSIAAAFGLPGAMLRSHLITLGEGVAVKFRARPVDPYDPFRGRYVQLVFDTSSVVLADPLADLLSGQYVYVDVLLDDDGFGQLGQAHLARPESGLFLEMRVSYAAGAGSIRIHWPFDRYYLNEKLAPEAERLYEEATRRASVERQHGDAALHGESYVVVRLREGKWALEALYIEGQPVELAVRTRS